MKPYTYIIGPTVGHERLNIDAFRAAAEWIKNADPGNDVVIPHDLFTDDEQRTMSMQEATNRRCEAVRNASEVRYLYGWGFDDAGQSEMMTARDAGKLIRPFYFTNQFIEQ